ncbi:hypothetical protein [Armatimonas sp.]|uniref:hypothetical protein n=1 Tax=Armatimonas sp. TaxID=1872638 RepID=UPI00286BB824|nr:hypothetical protein [Armatimonas sp.]
MKARLSQKQLRGRQTHLKILAERKTSSVAGNREADTTKETRYQRVSLPDGQTRESSPLREAANSQSSRSEKGQQRTAGTLLEVAHAIFPTRQVLYSLDVHGGRSQIDTSGMSEAGYQKLLEAFANPVRFDGPEPAMVADMVVQQQEPDSGCRIGSATGLPVPDWWQIPEPGATAEQIKAILKENLQKAGERQRGFGWKKALGRAL